MNIRDELASLAFHQTQVSESQSSIRRIQTELNRAQTKVSKLWRDKFGDDWTFESMFYYDEALIIGDYKYDWWGYDLPGDFDEQGNLCVIDGSFSMSTWEARHNAAEYGYEISDDDIVVSDVPSILSEDLLAFCKEATALIDYPVELIMHEVA